jgi:hypothetical protein
VLTAKEIGIMARQIDDSKPLSAEDRQWLKDWGRDAEIERIDQAHGVTDGGASQEDSSASDGERTTEEALAQLLRDNGVDPGDNPMEALVGVLTRSVGDPLGNGQQVVAPGESGSYAPGSPSGDDSADGNDGGDYTGEEWDKAALQEELGKRELSKSGNKAELIARLREDDADEE